MTDLFLGIDLGTGGCKLTLIDAQSGFLADEMVEYPTSNPHPGWSEQDPAIWIKAFYTCFDQLIQRTGLDPRAITALATDAPTHIAILLDKNNQVLRPCIMWNDQRSFAEVNDLRDKHGDRLFQLTYQRVSATWTLPQLLWVKRNEPDVFARIHRLTFGKDYLRFLLTGVWSTEIVDAGGTMLLDFEKKTWSEEVCELLGLPLSTLPSIGQSTDVVGTVLPDIARRLGLRDDVRVVAGASDTAVEDYAAGVLRPGQCIAKLATAGNVNMFSTAPQPNDFSFTYPYVVPGMYYAIMGTNAAAASLRWFRDNVVRKTGADLSFADLERPAHEVPPGSAGVIYHPYLNGERAPHFDPHLRASFVGLSSFHDLRHMTRAVMEGVAYSLRDCLDTAMSVGIVPDEVRLIGGGGKSPLWCQIVADVLGRPVIKLRNDDSSLGSAMVAAVGVGAFESFQHASAVCSVIERTYSPLPENMETYTKFFGLYRDIHNHLAPIYERLKDCR